MSSGERNECRSQTEAIQQSNNGSQPRRGPQDKEPGDARKNHGALPGAIATPIAEQKRNKYTDRLYKP